jgi:hypothetical protein
MKRDNWRIEFARGSSRLAAAVGAMIGRGRRNGQWHSHRNKFGAQRASSRSKYHVLHQNRQPSQVLILIPILNLVPIRRMLWAILQRSARMPNDPEKRTPEQTAQMARDVMRRMLESAPKPHDQMKKSKSSSRKRSRKK